MESSARKCVGFMPSRILAIGELAHLIMPMAMTSISSSPAAKWEPSILQQLGREVETGKSITRIMRWLCPWNMPRNTRLSGVLVGFGLGLGWVLVGFGFIWALAYHILFMAHMVLGLRWFLRRWLLLLVSGRAERRCSYAPYSSASGIAAILRPALPLYVYFTSFALALSFRRSGRGGRRGKQQRVLRHIY